jgi:hypothetical protein
MEIKPKRDRGLIAQEAREVKPDFVLENEGLLHVAQYPLIISLIKPVQELSKRITVLEEARARFKQAVFLKR